MSAIPAASASENRASGSTGVQNDKAILDKDGFLKLLVAQMTQQDPSSPMNASEQTQQMASFTMVEQITNMANANAKAASIGLIGRDVSYTDPGDKTRTLSGKVESVALGADGSYSLTISGQSGIKPETITKVA